MYLGHLHIAWGFGEVEVDVALTRAFSNEIVKLYQQLVERMVNAQPGMRQCNPLSTVHGMHIACTRWDILRKGRLVGERLPATESLPRTGNQPASVGPLC